MGQSKAQAKTQAKKETRTPEASRNGGADPVGGLEKEKLHQLLYQVLPDRRWCRSRASDRNDSIQGAGKDAGQKRDAHAGSITQRRRRSVWWTRQGEAASSALSDAAGPPLRGEGGGSVCDRQDRRVLPSLH